MSSSPNHFIFNSGKLEWQQNINTFPVVHHLSNTNVFGYHAIHPTTIMVQCKLDHTRDERQETPTSNHCLRFTIWLLWGTMWCIPVPRLLLGKVKIDTRTLDPNKWSVDWYRLSTIKPNQMIVLGFLFSKLKAFFGWRFLLGIFFLKFPIVQWYFSGKKGTCGTKNMQKKLSRGTRGTALDACKTSTMSCEALCHAGGWGEAAKGTCSVKYTLVPWNF